MQILIWSVCACAGDPCISPKFIGDVEAPGPKDHTLSNNNTVSHRVTMSQALWQVLYAYVYSAQQTFFFFPLVDGEM